MKDQIDVRGASGAVYRFARVNDRRPLSPMGGNWLYIREQGDGYVILCAGEGQNLLADSRARWDEAAAVHAAAHLFMRLNIVERIRKGEHADILEAARPVMNVVSAADA